MHIYGYDWGLFDRHKLTAVMRSKDRMRLYGSRSAAITERNRRNRGQADPERYCLLPVEMLGLDPEQLLPTDEDEFS
jgi:hypothetical protein